MAFTEIGSRRLASDPDVMFDLLDYFRETARFEITTEQYAVAQNLVLAMVTIGEDVDDPEVLKRYLAPIICTTPHEQFQFPHHLDHWLKIRPVPAPEPGPPIDDTQSQLQRTESQWSKWRRVSVLVIIGIVLAWVISNGLVRVRGSDRKIFTLPSAVPTSQPTDILFLSVGMLVAFLVLTTIAWAAWWFYRERLFLERRSTTETPDLVKVSSGTQMPEPYDPVFLRHVARELRRRYPVPSSDLDIEQTIARTILYEGEFTPAYRSRLERPDYLILVERRSFKDHNASLVGRIVDRLQKDQVEVERYYFDRDPRALWPVSPQEGPVQLRNLLDKNSDSRVLVLTAGDGFFSPTSGELETWTEMLWRRPHVAILTPKESEAWGYRENTLKQRVAVLPATIDSLANFAKACNGEPFQSRPTLSSHGPFPAELAERPERWLQRDRPGETLVTDVLAAVHRFLGSEAYFWLVACAAYPVVDFNLTLYLGANLNDASGRQLLTRQRLAALFRLPWFEHGYMPDWLRKRLCEELSPEDNESLQQVLDRLWLAAVKGSTKPIELEVARKNPNSLRILGRFVFRKLRRRAQAESPLRDFVFASVMLGRKVTPLAIRIPSFWRDLLRPRLQLGVTRAQKVVAIIVILTLSSWAIIMGATTHFQGHESNRILRVELGSDAAQLNQAVAAADDAGIANNIRMVIRNTYLDYVFILLYWLTFVSLAVLAGRMGKPILAVCAALLITGAAVSDLLENGAILTAMSVKPFTDAVAVDISEYSQWKWAFFFLASLLLGLAFVLRHRDSITSRDVSMTNRASGGLFIANGIIGLLGISRYRVSLDSFMGMVGVGTLLLTVALIRTLWVLYRSLRERDRYQHR